jgi:hypothetical protein
MVVSWKDFALRNGPLLSIHRRKLGREKSSKSLQNRTILDRTGVGSKVNFDGDCLFRRVSESLFIYFSSAFGYFSFLGRYLEARSVLFLIQGFIFIAGTGDYLDRLDAMAGRLAYEDWFFVLIGEKVRVECLVLF